MKEKTTDKRTSKYRQNKNKINIPAFEVTSEDMDDSGTTEIIKNRSKLDTSLNN